MAGQRSGDKTLQVRIAGRFVATTSNGTARYKADLSTLQNTQDARVMGQCCNIRENHLSRGNHNGTGKTMKLMPTTRRIILYFLFVCFICMFYFDFNRDGGKS